MLALSQFKSSLNYPQSTSFSTISAPLNCSANNAALRWILPNFYLLSRDLKVILWACISKCCYAKNNIMKSFGIYEIKEEA